MDTPLFDSRRYLPACCLGPDGAGPKALLVSTSRVDLAEGRTFAHLSLSEYYRALRLAPADASEKGVSEDEVWLPLRALDPDCLVAANGTSVLGQLLEHCDCLIVEDADLRPEDLVEHLRAFSLDGLAALDMTKALGLTGNHAYLLWCRSSRKPSLSGERIW